MGRFLFLIVAATTLLHVCVCRPQEIVPQVGNDPPPHGLAVMPIMAMADDAPEAMPMEKAMPEMAAMPIMAMADEAPEMMPMEKAMPVMAMADEAPEMMPMVKAMPIMAMDDDALEMMPMKRVMAVMSEDVPMDSDAVPAAPGDVPEMVMTAMPVSAMGVPEEVQDSPLEEVPTTTDAIIIDDPTPQPPELESIPVLASAAPAEPSCEDAPPAPSCDDAPPAPSCDDAPPAPSCDDAPAAKEILGHEDFPVACDEPPAAPEVPPCPEEPELPPVPEICGGADD